MSESCTDDKGLWAQKCYIYDKRNKQKHSKLDKTDVERRQTLGHPRSTNPNMNNHVPQQLPLIF